MRSSPLIAPGAFALLAATAPVFAFEPIVVIGGEAPDFPDGSQEIRATAAQTDGHIGLSTQVSPGGTGPGMIVQGPRVELWSTLE